jgi:hypothetical protein
MERGGVLLLTVTKIPLTSPSPLMGEGVGGGGKMVNITPHLNPPPQGGGEISIKRRCFYARI